MSDRKNTSNTAQGGNAGRKPDKADFHDDAFDVPTYEGPQTSTTQPSEKPQRAKADAEKISPSTEARTTIFERAGRAAPQVIEPNSSENRATGASVDSEPTTQFAQPEAATNTGATDAGAPNAGAADAGVSDAVDEHRPEYRDEDFAATEVIDPAGKQTTVPVAASATPQQAGYSVPTQQGVPQGQQGLANDEQIPVDGPYAQGTGGLAETPGNAASAEPVTTVDTRRGTIDLGLFLLRIALSAWLIIQATGTFFTLGSHEGIAGLESDFAAYNQAHLVAIAVPSVQLAAGIFLLLGLLAPVAAMLAWIVTGFLVVHELAQAQTGLNVFNWEETLWVPVMAAVLALVVQFTGPGLYALDGARGWARRPLASSWLFMILGIAAVVVAWWLLAGTNPLSA
ncbi:DoxX family protein [Corynebacterium pseudodiphtheriticum]|jgi:doxX family protein|uniref:DoxX family protein n=1 Tax=Corynebacterium pseudodiphtheriticum TaxID=37637 RepID=UPI000398DE89|nr:DoxX family protein [Corynebacterium pseudodiphtheriticum]ERJ46145.1 DoxX family protein [Corynebacterium pseudodiphtheriticum 090104]MDC7110488.1 DoxX family protein [Corynebacterium pseudodiphtheriticum]MDC7114443.1 DoxX family protein [Corynebacterium pseudodiphtheriticum]MDK4242784.1 DoxX family protein [Corynebacterium pseudodiphtheriticum]MDK4285633.1 DoxX family protein [Corynebacterium pseudodiphtheriticum]